MNKSAIEQKQNEQKFDIKNKTQLKKVVDRLLPSWRNVRILTNPDDARSNGNKVAICEQDQHGKLTVLVGAPTLSLAADFFKNAVEDGRVR